MVRLDDLMDEHGIGPVSCAGREILRRIFVSVRDRNWREVAPSRWASTADASAKSAALTARHTSELLDFGWRGRVDFGDDLRSLKFSFEGTALRDMEVCRLGLVVLHPIESMIGADVTFKGPHEVQRLVLAREIHPQPIVDGLPRGMTEPFSELMIERADFGILQLRFTGELFELEDQRNWGDATFKTYCTPLRLGFPRAVPAGTVVAQSLEAHFNPPIGTRSSQAKLRAGAHHRATQGRFPIIGKVFSEASAGKEDGSSWHYVHVDATTDPTATLQVLRRVPANTQLEVAVASKDDGPPAADLAALVADHGSHISRVLLHGPSSSPPTAAMVECALRELRTCREGFPILSATHGYFVEFNRAAPFAAPGSGLAFPLSGTVHADDTLTITDNVTAICDMAGTARQLTKSSTVAIAPLALHYPHSGEVRQFPRGLAAPWLVATLVHCAMSRVASVTLAEDVVEEVARSNGGLVLLSSLGACAGCITVTPGEEPPPGLHAAVIEPGRRAAARRMLVANVAATLTELCLSGTALRARKACDALTGADLPVTPESVPIPAMAVAWVDVETVGAWDAGRAGEDV